MGWGKSSASVRHWAALIVALMLTTVTISAQQEALPLLTLTPNPEEVRASAGSIAAMTVVLANSGSAPALGTLLQLVASGCLEISTDGLQWRKNMSINVGIVQPGGSVRQLIFIRCRGIGNATIFVSALADNHDPVILSVPVEFLPKSEGDTNPITILPYAVPAVLVSVLIATFLIAGRKTRRKRSNS